MEKSHVRFVQPVKDKDQSRVQNKPFFPGQPELQTFNQEAPIMMGAYRTPHDKAFVKDGE